MSAASSPTSRSPMSPKAQKNSDMTEYLKDLSEKARAVTFFAGIVGAAGRVQIEIPDDRRDDPDVLELYNSYDDGLVGAVEKGISEETGQEVDVVFVGRPDVTQGMNDLAVAIVRPVMTEFKRIHKRKANSVNNFSKARKVTPALFGFLEGARALSPNIEAAVRLTPSLKNKTSNLTIIDSLLRLYLSDRTSFPDQPRAPLVYNSISSDNAEGKSVGNLNRLAAAIADLGLDQAIANTVEAGVDEAFARDVLTSWANKESVGGVTQSDIDAIIYGSGLLTVVLPWLNTQRENAKGEPSAIKLISRQLFGEDDYMRDSKDFDTLKAKISRDRSADGKSPIDWNNFSRVKGVSAIKEAGLEKAAKFSDEETATGKRYVTAIRSLKDTEGAVTKALAKFDAGKVNTYAKKGDMAGYVADYNAVLDQLRDLDYTKVKVPTGKTWSTLATLAQEELNLKIFLKELDRDYYVNLLAPAPSAGRSRGSR